MFFSSVTITWSLAPPTNAAIGRSHDRSTRRHQRTTHGFTFPSDVITQLATSPQFTRPDRHVYVSRSTWRSVYISSHLISSQLTPFHLNWMSVSATQFAMAVTNQTRTTYFGSDRSQRRWTDRVGSERTHCHSVRTKLGQLRCGRTRWDVM